MNYRLVESIEKAGLLSEVRLLLPYFPVNFYFVDMKIDEAIIFRDIGLAVHFQITAKLLYCFYSLNCF